MEEKSTLDWIYYGMFLDDSAKASLQEAFSDIIPEGWKPYCDHMTVIYNDGSENAQKWGETCEKEVGKRTMLTVTELGISDRAIAVKVSGYPTNNSIPHITVAVAPGAKPVESNQITNWTPVSSQINLSATMNRVLKTPKKNG